MVENVFVARRKGAFQKKAVRLIIAAAREAIRKRGRFVAALSGGATPKGVYSLLAKAPYKNQVNWDRVYLFWGDERCVPPSHFDSNYRVALGTFIAKIPIPSKNVFRIPGEMRPSRKAALVYEKSLRRFLEKSSGSRFDLILLGVGADGHTASLFPRSKILFERRRWVRETFISQLSSYRITLTYPIINRSRKILFLCAGKSKAPVMRQVFSEVGSKINIPVRGIKPKNGEKIWILDTQAAQNLPGHIKYQEV